MTNKNPKAVERLNIIISKGRAHISDEIEEARKKTGFVIIDTEGSATELNSRIAAESDLVIVPMADEQQDAEDAVGTISEIRSIARLYKKTIPTRVLFSRTKAAVKSRLAKSLNLDMRGQFEHLAAELKERTAYSNLHNAGGGLDDLDMEDVSGVDKARKNAKLVIDEIISILEKISHEVEHA
ncbi:hypothetical protein [Ruegeria sp.]|uniref:hypothetical protein n=1 Tax=Ruegeria sp. TaxID=1879320 RepID=UPI003B00F1AE